ncbi:MAG: GNAT family N-acetyltransferase, partial [Acidimicrobiia bacterium]|nr:GNAT family N-acetyltransferase [Acidimicrobiia bacterium]
MDRELILEIEQRAVRAMPPVESVHVGRWVVALGRGTALRLNSCTTFGESPRRTLFEQIEQVERLYASRGRLTRFRLTPLDRHLDDRLHTRGYDRGPEVITMTGPVGGTTGESVAVARAAGPSWLERYREWGDNDELRTSEIAESLNSLTLDTGVFMSPAAIGVAVIDRPWVGLYDIVVDPAERGKGAGTELTAAMLAWAASQGAERSYLQVVATNEAAIGM